MSNSTATIAPLRGEGLVYMGSIVEARGTVVAEVTDCVCGWCVDLDEWDGGRRYDVRLVDGRRLVHARPSSFAGR